MHGKNLCHLINWIVNITGKVWKNDRKESRIDNLLHLSVDWTKEFHPVMRQALLLWKRRVQTFNSDLKVFIVAIVTLTIEGGIASSFSVTCWSITKMITFTQLDTGILVMEESDIEVNLISHVTVNYILFVCRICFEGMIIADKTYAIH